MGRIGEEARDSVSGRAIEEVAKAILDGNAILFLGPGATVNYEDPHKQSKYFKELAERDADQTRIVAYHEADEFLVFNRNGRKLMGEEIGRWYQQDFGNELLRLLAPIPFECIISLSPDTSIQDEFARSGFPCQVAHFSPSRTIEVSAPIRSRPLIYKLFGDSRDPESLIISHLDSFKLVKAIQTDRRLPDYILEALMQTEDQGKTIVFLGLEYHRWYFQFLLYFLHLRLGDWHFAIEGLLPGSDHQSYYRTEYKTLFVNEHPLRFVKALRGMLPKTSLRTEDPSLHLHELIWSHLNDAELSTMCLLHFPEVHKNFTQSMDKWRKMELLWDSLIQSNAWAKLHDLLPQMIPGPYNKAFP